VRAVSHLRGVYDIREAGVGQVRNHFIGYSNLKRDDAKAHVVSRCRQLGWMASTNNDNNAADALALWSFAVAEIDPQWGLQLSPLFNHKT
jgi:hypothetical protein